jgi:hypothetical protein
MAEVGCLHQWRPTLQPKRGKRGKERVRRIITEQNKKRKEERRKGSDELRST